MKHSRRFIPTVVGVLIVSGAGMMLADAAVRSAGSYSWLRRLLLKAGDAAADQAARQQILNGAPHEEYELTTGPDFYWDLVSETYRGQKKPVVFRQMWLDPVTSDQHFETYSDQALQHRYAFYYELHNRMFTCKSTGDAANSYQFVIVAGTRYRIVDRVVKSMPGYEVFQHPLAYEFGLNRIASSCSNLHDPVPMVETGKKTVARGAWVPCSVASSNADILYLNAGYDPVP